MDPGEHDVVHDVNARSTSGIGSSGLGDLAGLSLSSPPPTIANAGGSLSNDLFDLLDGLGTNTGTSNAPSLSSGPSVTSSFPSITSMPLFSAAQPPAVNGLSSQQYELIPGQFFTSSFFNASKAEQLKMLRDRADSGIMSGTSIISQHFAEMYRLFNTPALFCRIRKIDACLF